MLSYVFHITCTHHHIYFRQSLSLQTTLYKQSSKSTSNDLHGMRMIQSNSVPAEQARESKLSPSSVGSCTLQPSSSSFRTALTSPSRQASARLRAPGLKHQRANSSKTLCLAKTTAHVHECDNKKDMVKLCGHLVARANSMWTRATKNI